MGCDRLSSVALVRVSLRPCLSLVVSVSQVYGYVLIRVCFLTYSFSNLLPGSLTLFSNFISVLGSTALVSLFFVFF